MTMQPATTDRTITTHKRIVTTDAFKTPLATTQTEDTRIVPERLPNKAFDSEYMTEWGREVKFLADKGINYTFIRKTPVYNIKQYKYTKTPELFVALAEFYYQIRNERAYNRFNKAITESTTLPPDLANRLTSAVETGGSVG